MQIAPLVTEHSRRDRKVIDGKLSIGVGAHFLRDIEASDFMPGLDGRMAKISEVGWRHFMAWKVEEILYLLTG